ncbi:TPA: acyl-CoA/acyl-ACP dehydrogenase [Klebsiella michiganensis]|nr:acyl-CoA/acyl-ACP dehydrogenase [Klebsiella michiganensis]ELS4625828.1 acyl-CoA/acyl-ACP dehydrogenase [Klebsiella michiganensis]HCQ8473305.1 acyl-CoA/acyl-ACP dehydrogenase [Klebsiella michiganensis]HCU0766889.1 acyl-CoA/acyl-ACP dehydrogenase [Klebsiella michiganensis]HEP0441594.1 acyl-CoA/acyl-ACP dehydrogenase [Klebsiella michiganensis]
MNIAVEKSSSYEEPLKTNEEILDDVKNISRGSLAKLANSIDHEGYYPLDVMAALGDAGALGAHLESSGSRYDLALASMQEVGTQCGSTAFLMWCHAVCGLYMEKSGNPVLHARLINHAAGNSFGGTALSNPMKALAGIEPMLLRAKEVDGGYIINGTLPWVSHIAKGQYCGAIASVENDKGEISHEVIFILDLDERVELSVCPEFSGMEGTSTWRIRLTDYFIGKDSMVADPARPFVMRIRGAFILLQIGMATGLIQASIDSMREVSGSLGHINSFLHDGPDQLQAEFDELSTRVSKLALTPFDESKDYLLDVLDARAHGAELALKATQSALLHHGARGYLRSAGPQRRVREAHFVAIVTPAIKHLRWEMAKLLKEEMPV